MKNLVEKFTPEAVEATNEDGVVAIEYVMLAVAVLGVVGAVAALLVPGLATRLGTALTGAGF